MDFKIDENYDEEAPTGNKKNNKLGIIIVAITSILFGLSVFFVSNAIFGKKTTPIQQPVNRTVDIQEDNVQILYSYVTYGARGIRNDKFIREQKTSIDSFTNEEKYYYALQFVQVEDFISTDQMNENHQKIYTIAASKIKNYMQRYFGSKVTYSTSIDITYPFSFRINNQNVGVMKYTIEKDAFETIFTGLEENIIPDEINKTFDAKLVKATKNGTDGSLSLQEKIIYMDVKEENGIYTINIYKDFQHTMLIETRQNLTKEQLQQNPISIDNYLQKAATITYVFKLDNRTYYFDSSSISN